MRSPTLFTRHVFSLSLHPPRLNFGYPIFSGKSLSPTHNFRPQSPFSTDDPEKFIKNPIQQKPSQIYTEDPEKKMSGGVGPTYNDITLPQEQQEHDEQLQETSINDTTTQKPAATKTHRIGGSFLSFPLLNSLAIIIVFSASGLISLDDFAFVVFSFFYIYFLSKIAFPPKNAKDGKLTNPNNKVFRLYVAAAGVVGLVIPICYIFEGIFEGDKNGMKAAAPHVFLLASQVFMEGVASSRGFSAPIRILVPIFYNARRILTLLEWLKNEFSKDEYESGSVTPQRLYAGKVLALANTGLWSFNLFGVLLPVYLPRAFKRYYGESNKEN